MPDAWLEEEVCGQLQRALGVGAPPIFRRIYRHRPGLPQYEVGHAERVAAVEAAEARLPGLYITGNAFRGVGINACTADAQRVVERVLRQLQDDRETADYSKVSSSI
jgi:oxygen-dependent protoporphyrinogen oxidase